MTPQEDFLSWLKQNDPFVYAVVVERAKVDIFNAKSSELNGLGFGWGSITSLFSSPTVPAISANMMGPPISLMAKPSIWSQISSGVVSAAKTLPSVLMDYKVGKDAKDAQKKAQRRATNQPPPRPAPAPNVASTDEILRRLAIAQQGGRQPGGAYTPMIDPKRVGNFPRAVKVAAKKPTKWQIAVALKLASMPLAERTALIKRNAAKKARAESDYMKYLPVGLGFLLLFSKKLFK